MNIPSEPKARHVTANAVQRVTRRLDLPDGGGMQDWPLEIANPSRLDEFVKAYDEDWLDDDDRFAIVQLITASFDEARSEVMEAIWPAIREILERHTNLHRHTIYYWSCWDAEDIDDPEQQFRASPYLRRIPL